MGNARSAEVIREDDIWWINGNRQEAEQESSATISGIQEKINSDNDNDTTISDSTSRLTEREQRQKEMQEDFIKFKQELARKHERRRELIAEKKKEMADIRDELIREKEENNRLRRLLETNKSLEVNNTIKSQEDKVCNTTVLNSLKEENEDLRNEVQRLKLALEEKEMIVDKNKELRISLAEMQKELQSVNTQVISFEKERIDYQEHVTALKDIIKVSKEMLRVRENQIDELKKKIETIEELLASKEISILSDDLRQEYERQLRNIRDLRNLYEDRQRADRREKENLHSIIDDLKKKVEEEENKNRELTERVTELEEDNSKKYDKIVNLESSFGLANAECRELHAEMNIINQLFSQILISFNNDQDIDLDNMIKTLEENHALLTNIVSNDESSETSALPKVLLDLIKQVNESRKKDDKEELNEIEKEIAEEADKENILQEVEENQLPGLHQLNSPEEIVENLPKVWRVLIELLSHQSPPNNEITEKKGENESHCYKSVETPTGLRKVLSVSKTFIRLKSLILEKKSLEKEMTRLKQLNTHLEGRLSDQEKRLVLVSDELSKTWNFVGKMQKQHQQLHTQEKILRYELAQKRKLLTELKEELEYCRQKWSQARKQNSSTEEQWKQLRSEFASRKTSVNDNSVESGFSDDKSSSDEDDPGFEGKSKGNTKASISQSKDVSETGQEQFAGAENLNLENKNQDNSLSKEHTQIEENPQSETFTEILNREEAESLEAENHKNEDEIQNERCSSPLFGENEDSVVSLDDLKTNAVNSVNEVNNSNECSETLLSTERLISSQSSLSSDSFNSSGTMKTEVDTKDEIDRLNSQICENIKENITQNSIQNNSLLVNSFDNVCVPSSSQSKENENSDQPTTFHKNPVEVASEFAARREAKMKKLEEECNELFHSVAKTSLRGMAMSHKLDNLHEMYGESSQTVDQDTSGTQESDQATENKSSPVTHFLDNNESNQE